MWKYWERRIVCVLHVTLKYTVWHFGKLHAVLSILELTNHCRSERQIFFSKSESKRFSCICQRSLMINDKLFFVLLFNRTVTDWVVNYSLGEPRTQLMEKGIAHLLGQKMCQQNNEVEEGVLWLKCFFICVDGDVNNMILQFPVNWWARQLYPLFSFRRLNGVLNLSMPDVLRQLKPLRILQIDGKATKITSFRERHDST